MQSTASPTVKFKLLHPDAKMPTKATEHAACFDVVAVSREIKDGYVSYGLGFATEIPDGWQAKCYARSSISNMDLILCNGVGIIDADYRGEWSYRFKVAVPMRSMRKDEALMDPVGSVRLYEVGDRIGQIQFRPLPSYAFEVVEELSDTARGTGGFGSTGS